jgi:hypothetical protein
MCQVSSIIENHGDVYSQEEKGRYVKNVGAAILPGTLWDVHMEGEENRE